MATVKWRSNTISLARVRAAGLNILGNEVVDECRDGTVAQNRDPYGVPHENVGDRFSAERD
jgi:hypothetical protein